MPINYFAFNQTYRERKGRDHQETTNIDEFCNLLSQPGKVYEVLLDTPVKLFIDVDGIPTTEPNLIFEFIDKFISFMNITFNVKINKFALTKNEGSLSHPGLSYHVYFPEYYLSKIYDIKFILLKFTEFDEDHKFYDYIDGCIYHFNRLFRCPNQYNASREAIDELDVHKVIQGIVKDCVVQYVDESQQLLINCDYRTVRTVKLKNTSGDGENKKLKFEKINILKKLKKVKDETKYDKLNEFKEANIEKSKSEMASKIIKILLDLGRPIDDIDFDKLELYKLQEYASGLEWIINILDDFVDEMKKSKDDSKELEKEQEEPKVNIHHSVSLNQPSKPTKAKAPVIADSNNDFVANDDDDEIDSMDDYNEIDGFSELEEFDPEIGDHESIDDEIEAIVEDL